jgi:hypothetical protein
MREWMMSPDVTQISCAKSAIHDAMQHFSAQSMQMSRIPARALNYSHFVAPDRAPTYGARISASSPTMARKAKEFEQFSNVDSATLAQLMGEDCPI